MIQKKGSSLKFVFRTSGKAVSELSLDITKKIPDALLAEYEKRLIEVQTKVEAGTYAEAGEPVKLNVKLIINGKPTGFKNVNDKKASLLKVRAYELGFLEAQIEIIKAQV